MQSLTKSLALASALFIATAWSQAGIADIYEEDFEDGLAQSWVPQHATQWKVAGSTANQMYRAKPPAAFDGNMVSTYGGTSFQDFDYRVSTKHDNIYATYILFRATPNFSVLPASKGSGYAFGVDCDFSTNTGYYYLFQHNNGVETTIQSWTEAPSLKCNTQSNRIRIVAKGKNLKFFINNNLVYQFQDTFAPIKSGRIGLFGFSLSDYPTTHYFDNIVVTPIVSSTSGIDSSDEISKEQQLLNSMPSSNNNPARVE